MRPRRVGVNLLWLVPGVVGGTEDAVCGFLEEVARQGPDDLDLTLYVQPDFARAHPTVAAAYRCREVPVSGRNKAVRVATEILWLGVRARLDRLDLVHHYGGVVPPLASRPSVLTVHDVQPLAYPENFDRAKRLWLGRMLPRSVKVARLVIVPSLAARDSLVERTGVDPAKLRVVWHGVSLRHPTSPTSEARGRVRRTYRLPGQFVLYPAITYPHKAHADLVEAFALVARRDPHAVLVLAGGAASAEAEVQVAIERHGLGDRVRRIGRVPRDDLDTLLVEASVLAFPSRFEGFGLPLIEAMAAGCPVVANDASAISEVVGDAGLLVDAADPEVFADAIHRLLTDQALVEQLIARGRVRVLRFAWRELAGAVLDIYREAVRLPVEGPHTPLGVPAAPGAPNPTHQEAAS